jgi:hypothetical protein
VVRHVEYVGKRQSVAVEQDHVSSMRGIGWPPRAADCRAGRES